MVYNSDYVLKRTLFLTATACFFFTAGVLTLVSFFGSVLAAVGGVLVALKLRTREINSRQKMSFKVSEMK